MRTVNEKILIVPPALLISTILMAIAFPLYNLFSAAYIYFFYLLGGLTLVAIPISLFYDRALARFTKNSQLVKYGLYLLAALLFFFYFDVFGIFAAITATIFFIVEQIYTRLTDRIKKDIALYLTLIIAAGLTGAMFIFSGS